MSKLFGNSPRLFGWPLRAALMGAVGVAVYFIGNLAPFRDTILGHCFEGIGLSLFCSTVVALVLERLVHASILAQMKKAFEHFRDSAEVLKGSTRLGIRDMVARRDPKLRDKCDQHIVEALTRQLAAKSGEICICCVAAPDYLGSATAIGHLLLTELAKPGNTCKLRVLLLDPEGRWAKIRRDLEDGHFVKSDIAKASHFIHTLQKAVAKADASKRSATMKNTARKHGVDDIDSSAEPQPVSRVQLQFYDIPPVAFLIITDDLLFQETYPLVPVRPEDGPIGGRTPLLIFDNECESYKLWRGHFRYVWDLFSRKLSPYSGLPSSTLAIEDNDGSTPLEGGINLM